MEKSNFPFPVDEHGDLLLALAPLFKTLQDLAKQGECTFPVELVITDANDDTLWHVELGTPEGLVTDLSGRDPNAKPLPIHWPVTVRATDAVGREWEQTIDGPTVQ